MSFSYQEEGKVKRQKKKHVVRDSSSRQEVRFLRNREHRAKLNVLPWGHDEGIRTVER